jgi:excisionase family DNA binding protein
VPFDPPSAAELLSRIASDPEALAVLRRLVDADTDRAVPAYTVATLAAALGVTERVVRNAIARGELHAVKRGARWLIATDAVDAWTRDGDDCHDGPVESYATVAHSQRASPRSTTAPTGRRSIGSRRERASQRCEVGGPVSGGRPEPVAELRSEGRCGAV